MGLIFALLAGALLYFTIMGITLALRERQTAAWMSSQARKVTMADLVISTMEWAGKAQREMPLLAALSDKLHEPIPKWLGAKDPGRDIWLVRKELYLVGGFIIGAVLLESASMGVLCGIGAVLLPDLLARDRYVRRQEQIQRELPDVLDLLSLSLEAGLSIDTGFAQVAEKYRGKIIADSMARMLGEIRFGARRHDAWRSMTEGLGNAQFTEVIGAVIQADSMGVGLVQALKGLATQARIWRRQQVEELAQKAPVKMLFPLVLFIFPAIFIVLLGPILLQLTEVMR